MSQNEQSSACNTIQGQCYELFALAEEEQVAPNEERAGVQVDEACQGGVDLAFGAGLEDLELQPP